MDVETRVRRATADERDVLEEFLRATYVESGKSFPFLEHSKQDAWMFVSEDTHGETVAAASAVWDPATSTVTMEHFGVAPHWRSRGVGSQLLAEVDAFVQVDFPTCTYLAIITDASPKMEAWAHDRFFREVSGGFLPASTGRYVVYRKHLLSADDKDSHDIMGDFLAQVIKDDEDHAAVDANPAHESDGHQGKHDLFASLLSNIPLGKIQAMATSLEGGGHSAIDMDVSDEDANETAATHETSDPDDQPSLDSLVRLLMHQLKDPAQRGPLFESSAVLPDPSTPHAAAGHH